MDTGYRFINQACYLPVGQYSFAVVCIVPALQQWDNCEFERIDDHTEQAQDWIQVDHESKKGEKGENGGNRHRNSTTEKGCNGVEFCCYRRDDCSCLGAVEKRQGKGKHMLIDILSHTHKNFLPENCLHGVRQIFEQTCNEYGAHIESAIEIQLIEHFQIDGDIDDLALHFKRVDTEKQADDDNQKDNELEPSESIEYPVEKWPFS